VEVDDSDNTYGEFYLFINNWGLLRWWQNSKLLCRSPGQSSDQKQF